MDYKRMFLDENDSPNEDQCDKLVIPKLKNESKSQVLRE